MTQDLEKTLWATADKLRNNMKNKLLLLAIGFALTTQIIFAQIPSNIPTKGLVGYWPFNNNANDESGNGNNGTVYGATLTTDRFGNVNKAYNFSGSDWIELNSLSAINISSELAVSIWVKSTGFNSNTNCNMGCLQYYFSRGFDSGLGFGLSTFQGDNPHFSATVNGPFAGGQQVQSPDKTDIPHTQWHHLLMNYNGTSINFYVDGLLSATIPYTMRVGIDKKSKAVFGRQFIEGSSYYTVGMIDDAAIWNRALTNEEIGYLFSEKSNKITNITKSSIINDLFSGQPDNNSVSTSKELENNNSKPKSIAENKLINPKLLELKEIISDSGCIVFSLYSDLTSVSWSGTCKDSLANGKGILKYIKSNGEITIYEGETLNGYRNGKGKYNWTTGEKYEGEWKDDKANGIGIYTYPNGSKYEGQLSDGKKNGNGMLTDINGDKYEGEWKGDLRNGQGTYTWSSGSKYVGQFRDDKPNGQGTFTWPSGSRYVGQHKDGNRDGQGILTDSDGSKYEGEWKDDKKHGQGTYTYSNSSKYVGEFIDGYFSGNGIFTDISGEIYEGEWKYNSKHGQGIYTWPDGSKHVGEWKDNKANGQGTYTYSNGKEIFGEWKDSKLVQESKQKVLAENSKQEPSQTKNLEAFAAFMRAGSSSSNSTKQNNSSSNSSNNSNVTGKIYTGKYVSYNNQVALFENGKIYTGKYVSSNNQVGLIEGNKVYKGKYVSSNNQVGLIEGNKIYSGKYVGYNNQVGLIEGGYTSVIAGAAYLLLL
jgi:hypothetical protein